MCSNIKNYHSKLVSWVFFCCCHQSTPWVSVLLTRASLHTHLGPPGPQGRPDFGAPPHRAGLFTQKGSGCPLLWVPCLSHTRPLSPLEKALLHPLAKVPFHSFCPFKMVQWIHAFNILSFGRLKDGCGFPFRSVQRLRISEREKVKGDTGPLQRPESREGGGIQRQIEPAGLRY